MLDVIGGRLDARRLAHPADRRAKAPPLGAEELLFVWPHSSGESPRKARLPPLIAIDRERQREFFAWVSTFLTDLSPFTAHCRVVDPSDLARVESLDEREPSLAGVEGASVALILVEAKLAGEPSPGLGLCRRSLSYALARSVALGAAAEAEDQVAESWLRLQQRAAPTRPLSKLDSLRRVWREVARLTAPERTTQLDLGVAGGPRTLPAACRELFSAGEVQRASWTSLVQGDLELTEAPKSMEGSREDRVTVLERSIARLRRLPNGEGSEKAFAAGYLASRVAPGSIEHLPLVVSSAQEFAGAEYWYALAAGLSKHSDARAFSRGVGGRLLRDLLRRESLSASPEADVSIPELDVLLAGDRPAEIGASFPGYLLVELGLGVTTCVRWGIRSTTEQAELFGAQGREDTEVVRRLGAALDEANYLFRRLTGPRERNDREKRGRR